MTSGKMNDSLFKEFCEGRLQTSKLFKDGQFNIVHQSRLIFTSNEMPNIKLDSGVSRRTEAYYHNSKFLTEQMINDGEQRSISTRAIKTW